MTDRSFRAITLGLLASTALATPALAQNAQPQNTQGQAPSINITGCLRIARRGSTWRE